MKTSNYIIIAFFVFLFGGIFVLFVAAKMHQRDNNGGPWLSEEKKLIWLSEEKKLESFSVVVAEPQAYFQLRIGENPRIRSSYQKPDTCNFPPFGIRNDTLFVFPYPDGEKKLVIQDVIFVKGIKSIIAKEKSYLNLQEFWADSLIIKLKHAQLDAFFDKTKNRISKFSIQAEESKMKLANANIERVDIQISQSIIQALDNSIGSLSGTLNNHSNIQVRVMEKVNVEVDSTSNYNILK